MVREITTIEEDEVVFQAQNRNIDRIAQFGNRVFKSREDITEARLQGNRIRFGIWEGDIFIGTISYVPSEDGQEAEVGTWLAEETTGHGNAAAARKCLSEYLVQRYRRVYAETDVNNVAAIRSLGLTGYRNTDKQVERHWGLAAVFEFIK